MIRKLAVLLIVLGAGFWYFSTTPDFSIWQMRNAIKAHDVAAFHKYVDVDSVASGIVEAVMAKPMIAAAQLGPVGSLLGQGLLAFVKPAAVQAMKEEIDHMVEGRSNAQSFLPHPSGFHLEQPAYAARQVAYLDEPPTGGISLKRLLKFFGFEGHTYRGISYRRQKNKVAHVGLNLYNLKFDREMILDLKMRDMGGYWSVVELSNLPEMLDTLMALQLKDDESNPSYSQGDSAPIYPQPSEAL